MSIGRRVAAVLTAFRAETQIELSLAPVGLTGDVEEVIDVTCTLALWCARHEAVLAQHGLYLETEKGSDRCQFSMTAPAGHQRVTWTEKAAPKQAAVRQPIEDDGDER